MVSTLSILSMVVTVLISIGLPIILAIYMYRKYRAKMKAVLVGALMFIIFQGVLRIPLMTYIQTKGFYKDFAGRHMVITMLIIALTAALFETAGRYIGLKFLLKNDLEWKNGIAYGIGHGGIEAVMLVGISYAANLVLSILINTHNVSSLMYSQLIETRSDLFLAAGVERLVTIIFHIALSLIVLYAIMYRKKIYVLLCIALHTFVDFSAIFLSAKKVPVWGIEGCLVVIGILSLIYIIKSREIFNDTSEVNS